jgi:hypothetical protein
VGNDGVGRIDLLGMEPKWKIISDVDADSLDEYMNSDFGIVSLIILINSGFGDTATINVITKILINIEDAKYYSIEVKIDNYYTIRCNENGKIAIFDQNIDPPVSDENGYASWYASSFLSAGAQGESSITITTKPEVKLIRGLTPNNKTYAYRADKKEIIFRCVECKEVTEEESEK